MLPYWAGWCWTGLSTFFSLSFSSLWTLNPSWDRYLCIPLTSITLFNPHHAQEVGTRITPTLQVSTLRPWEAEELSLLHKATMRVQARADICRAQASLICLWDFIQSEEDSCDAEKWPGPAAGAVWPSANPFLFRTHRSSEHAPPTLRPQQRLINIRWTN